ncbi:hypothetical protein PQX77_009235 [Marasmius sp. AFHP31]|nr:hypothetical protein PQX77_009235 [Marasmius sp. AFHP31]
MLPKELGGVIDQDLKVYGVDRLRVVDTSSFPIEFSTHPVVTVYAMAEKAAVIIEMNSPGSPDKSGDGIGGDISKGAHWARYSFLRLSVTLFEKVLKKQDAPVGVAGSAGNQDAASDAEEFLCATSRTYKASEYWNFVDDQLDGFRADALAKAQGDRKLAGMILGRFFQSILQEDLKIYNSFPNGEELTEEELEFTPEGAPWQKVIGKGMVFATDCQTA